MGKATGIIEVFGLACAFVACDAGCKAADVTVETFDKNKPANADKLPVPLIVCIKFRGTVDNVTAAVEAAKEAANSMCSARDTPTWWQKSCISGPAVWRWSTASCPRS